MWSFVLNCAQECVVVYVDSALFFTISLSARSSASHSCALAAMQLAHERVCASPCPPTHILPCADRSADEIGGLLTGQQLPSEPQCVLSAS